MCLQKSNTSITMRFATMELLDERVEVMRFVRRMWGCDVSIGPSIGTFRLSWNVLNAILATHYRLCKSKFPQVLYLLWSCHGDCSQRLAMLIANAPSRSLHFEDIVRDAIRVFVASRSWKSKHRGGQSTLGCCACRSPALLSPSGLNQLYLCIACCCSIVG